MRTIYSNRSELNLTVQFKTVLAEYTLIDVDKMTRDTKSYKDQKSMAKRDKLKEKEERDQRLRDMILLKMPWRTPPTTTYIDANMKAVLMEQNENKANYFESSERELQASRLQTVFDTIYMDVEQIPKDPEMTVDDEVESVSHSTPTSIPWEREDEYEVEYHRDSSPVISPTQEFTGLEFSPTGDTVGQSSASSRNSFTRKKSRFSTVESTPLVQSTNGASALGSHYGSPNQSQAAWENLGHEVEQAHEQMQGQGQEQERKIGRDQRKGICHIEEQSRSDGQEYWSRLDQAQGMGPWSGSVSRQAQWREPAATPYGPTKDTRKTSGNPNLRKTQPCRVWNGIPGSCRFGDRCDFIHHGVDPPNVYARVPTRSMLENSSCGHNPEFRNDSSLDPNTVSADEQVPQEILDSLPECLRNLDMSMIELLTADETYIAMILNEDGSLNEEKVKQLKLHIPHMKPTGRSWDNESQNILYPPSRPSPHPPAPRNLFSKREPAISPSRQHHNRPISHYGPFLNNHDPRDLPNTNADMFHDVGDGGGAYDPFAMGGNPQHEMYMQGQMGVNMMDFDSNQYQTGPFNPNHMRNDALYDRNYGHFDPRRDWGMHFQMGNDNFISNELPDMHRPGGRNTTRPENFNRGGMLDDRMTHRTRDYRGNSFR